MTNPYKVEVFVKEHAKSADGEPFSDSARVEYLVAHTQHVHEHDLDPAVSVHADDIDILRTVQLLSGALSVVLCSIASADDELGKTLARELAQQLSTCTAQGSVAVKNPVATPNVLDSLDDDQKQMLAYLSTRPGYRGRH